MIGLIQMLLESAMLVLSVILVFAEALITAITMLLPNRVIEWFTEQSRRLLRNKRTSSEANYRNDPALKAIVNRVCSAGSFVELCDIFRYEAEEHVVPTRDGYLLSVHRIAGGQGEPWRDGPPIRKPVVYLHHGLLMNSEVWVACTDPSHSVAFALADQGYDVWLGNNRGNKYSSKHISKPSTSAEFWNFSIDDLALFDIPDTIEYILRTTGQESLAYIGFSQGSAQAFASFSIHPQLTRKVHAFVALAPAMAPPGVNSFVQTFTNASPSLLYMIFGNKIILRSAIFWQNIMYPPLFVRVIDLALDWLFYWKSRNITYAQKMVGYAHLYSFTSVKCVVHWFQIIRAKTFQMYDDNSLRPSAISRFSRVLRYPTRNIRIPIAVIYGMNDSLLDLQALLSELPSSTRISGVPGYEHLDMLWGEAVSQDIIPRIQESLAYCMAVGKKQVESETRAIQGNVKYTEPRSGHVSSRSASEVINLSQSFF